MQASHVLQARLRLAARPRERRRVQELASARERVRLARSVRGVVKDLSASRLPGASPLNRVALRPHAPLLAALADRLADLERPVGAAGLLAVRRLLTDPDGPLYARPSSSRGDEVGRALREVLRELESC